MTKNNNKVLKRNKALHVLTNCCLNQTVKNPLILLWSSLAAQTDQNAFGTKQI